jgi:NarL family two-component system response regulator LiaR
MHDVLPIRVMIVDDHDMVRRGLAAFLRVKPELELVGEARDGIEALQICEKVRPDVVVMDLVLPRMSGAETTRAIRKHWPRVQVVALTSFEERELVREALSAGAIGYLLKNVSVDDLAAAIHAAHAGRSTLSPEAVQALIESESSSAALDYQLTAREQEVLALLVQGMSNPEIADSLVVSRATAKAHVSNILSKLGVSNRSEAVALAIQQNLVDPGQHRAGSVVGDEG